MVTLAERLSFKNIIHSRRMTRLLGTLYTTKEENNIDPDDGNTWMCMACKLPIFSTPFKQIESTSISSNNNNLYHHGECSNPPKDLQHTVWHISPEPLVLLPNSQETARCSKCNDLCGSVMYGCQNSGHDLTTLDLKCAVTIKIVHMSHDHKLMVIRSGLDASFSCGACGTTHQPGMSWAQPVPLVYVCSGCCFWLHPHCASLPNAILLKHPHPNPHPHPLLLNYRWSLFFYLRYINRSKCPCAICGEKIKSPGAYSCTKCDFYVHIMCAVTDKHSFESVLIRDAQFPDLNHFPIPDEHTSVVRHITGKRSSTTTSTNGVVHVHQHPLTLNHHYPDENNGKDGDRDEDDEEVDQRPSCDACVQLISPPFYTCSECPNLFLHDCCAHVPPKLKQDHKLTLNVDRAAAELVETSCCRRRTNGFTYSRILTVADVKCAIMPASITHEAHSKTHILYSSFDNELMSRRGDTCHCCGLTLDTFFYYCGTCQSFKIHAKCAQLPRTVRHVFDKHPLELVTAHIDHILPLFCDACEEALDHTRWYYRCHICDQSFHVDCIPCLDNKSLIQFGKPQVRVKCHKCPLALSRGETARGRRCGYCREIFKLRYSDSLVLECSKCYFWLHRRCAYQN